MGIKITAFFRNILWYIEYLNHTSQTVGRAPRRALLVLFEGELFILRTYLFWTKYGRKYKIYILVGTLFGWNINLALFYNLNFTKVYINLEKFVIN
jgi:hypothetical protein